MRTFTFLFFSLFPFIAQAQFGQYAVLEIADSLKKGADAVYQLDELQVDIQDRDRMEIRANRIITVLNSKGNEHLNAFVYHDDSREVTDLEATIYDGLGNEISSFRKKEFADVSAVDGGTLYSDSRVFYLPYTPVTYPYTVHLSYTVESANTSPLPAWFFLNGYRQSTVKSIYEFRFSNPEYRPDILEQNLAEIKLERKDDGKSIRYTAMGLKPLKQEPLSPPLSEIVPALRVRPRHFFYENYSGFIDTWQDLGKWMHGNLLKGREELPEQTKQMARNLVSGIEDPLEKARVIYEYVQQNTRYISVQVGIGGIQPIAASEVDRLKYGDCKGLSNYTKALLEAVGVPSYYVHVYAGENKLDFLPDFADLAQGNHVILAIPDGENLHWVDCTSQTLPFGFTGDFTDDRLAHVIREDGGELVRTPAYLNNDNLQLTSAHCELDANGRLRASVKRITKGTRYESHYPLEKASSEEVLKYYQNQWAYLSNLEIESAAFKNDKRQIRFVEELELEAGNNTKLAGQRLLFAVNLLNRFSDVPDRVRDRKQPFEVLRGFEDQEAYQIRLPEEYEVESLPPPAQLETPYGKYHMEVSYQPEEHYLVYKRSLLLKEGLYPKIEYKAFRDFCIAIGRYENAQAVLIRKNNQPN